MKHRSAECRTRARRSDAPELDPNPSNENKPKRVAIVIASPATSSTTGWPVGFWWSELTHPSYAFHGAGHLPTTRTVDVANPRRYLRGS